MTHDFFSCPDCNERMVGDVHVMPIDDLLPHYERVDCHCDPEVEIHGAQLLIIHNSFDGREEFEE